MSGLASVLGFFSRRRLRDRHQLFQVSHQSLIPRPCYNLKTETNQPTNSMEQSPSEKLTGSQLLKKFPSFYGTRRFITAFTRARQLSLS